MHISWIQDDWGKELFSEFESCFEQFYLSHEMHLRKPNADIYEFVLSQNDLNPEEDFLYRRHKREYRHSRKLRNKSLEY